MSVPAATISVSATESVACIKITGRANFTSSIDFKALIYGLLQRDIRKFLIDLTECIIMDSTFLGVMAGFGLRLAETAPGTTRCQVELLNPNQRVADLFENLGVAHLFKISRGPNPFTTCFEAVTPGPEAAKTEVSRTCLEAHQMLMKINPDNVPKFKDVARFLAEDLKRMESESTASH